MEEVLKKDKILDAARRLFEVKGFDRTTVREIASRAHANVALIHYYFGSKENMLKALVEDLSDQIRLRLTDINNSASGPFEKLRQVIDYYVERLHSNREYYQMIHRELSTELRPELHDELAKILKRNGMVIRKIFEEGQNKKVFRKDIDVDLIISTIFGLMYQTTHPEFSRKYGATGTPQMFQKRIKKHLTDMLQRHLLK